MNFEAILSAARAISDPVDLGLFLDFACRDNPDLLARVQASLLNRETSDSIESNILPTLPAETSPGIEQERIGSYKLLNQIGEGGMGTVYLAEQSEPVRRRVALKIIKQGMDNKEVVARFESERQAISMMDHPNIAKVLDVGTTANGRPFFAMELVKGIPFTQYCDEQDLSISVRLRLFCSICNGVHHAHQRGIIHRDLKPSNILVAEYGGEPVPKIIDFGLAKALNQHLTEKTIYTQVGQVLGTFAYMSPEQSRVNQLDIDVRADVYSLGVILYETVTGTTPLDRERLKQAELDQILRIIREEEPPAPSVRLSEIRSVTRSNAERPLPKRNFRKLASGELDWIALKALEKDRSRRYESAIGLARDIQRHLDGDPVEAAPASVWYRCNKSIRRHKLAYLTSTIVLTSLVLGMIGTSIGFVQANRSRSQAEQARSESESRRERTRDALDMMSGKMLDEWLLTSPEITDRQREFLRDVMVYYEEFGNESTETDDGKLSVAKAAQRLAIIQDELGDTDASLDRHLNAIEILDSVEQPNLDVERTRAFSYQSIGRMYLSSGDYANARTYFSRSRIALLTLCQEYPDDAESHQLLARQYYSDAKVRLQNGENRYGLQLLEDAKQAIASFIDRFPNNVVIEYSLVRTLQGLAFEYRFSGREDEVVSVYQEAIQRLRAMLVADPPNRQLRSLLGICINDLGVHYKSNRQFEQALELYEESATIRFQLRHQFPNSIDIATSLAGTYQNIGNIKRLQGDFSDANDYFEQATEVCNWVMGRNPDDVRAKRFLRNIKEAQGESHLATHEYQAALTAFEVAIDIHDGALAATSSSIGPRLTLRRAAALARLGRIRESLQAIEQELATSEDDINADGAEKYHASLAYAALFEMTSESTEIELQDRETWATEAIAMLRIAITYRRANSEMRMTEWMNDPELDCLREHPDFLELVELPNNVDGNAR